MEHPVQVIEWGYPLKIFYFTGKYFERTIGYYKAMRNKRTIYVPIYKSKDGEVLHDMHFALHNMSKMDKREEVER